MRTIQSSASASVTCDNAESKIREYADALSPSMKGSAGRSTLAEAKLVGTHLTARAVNNLPVEYVSAFVLELTRAFEKTVDTLTEAVKNLPEDLDADSIVAGSPSVLMEYRTAKATVVSMRSRDRSRMTNSIDPLLRRLAERKIIVAPPELETQPDGLGRVHPADRALEAETEAKLQAEAEAS